MAAEAILSEALFRIEYKLDVVLDYLGRTNPALLAKILQENRIGESQVCVACGRQVTSQVDIINKVITRKCGCSSGKSAPIDLGIFAPPLSAKKETENGSDQDNRENSDGGGSYRRR